MMVGRHPILNLSGASNVTSGSFPDVAIWIAAALLVAAVALFVAAPLTDGLLGRRGAAPNTEIERQEHQRSLAVQGLRELEFDHEMGKLDNHDYRRLRQGLETRALRAMNALQAASALHINFCKQCRTRNSSMHNFCPNCGAKLGPAIN
jgi:cytochrome c-type biogenesis protein CcmI